MLTAILSITIYLFLLIVANYNSEKYKVVYFLGIFLSPLLITGIPFVKDAYSRAGVWCWIVSVDKYTCMGPHKSAAIVKIIEVNIEEI